MKFLKIKKNKGFVILFAIIATSIILTVSFGLANISLQEINFSTSAKDTNEAFYAADIGAECALANDKSASTSFVISGGAGSVTCMGSSTPFTSRSANSWAFTLTGLGTSSGSCANVTVTKDFATNPVTTTIDSKGYNKGDNSCNFTANRVERSIKVTYGGDPNGSASLVASPSTVSPGGTVTVTFDNVPTPTVLDYIGLYLASAGNPSAEINYKYASGSPTCSTTPGGSALVSGSCTFTMPMSSNDYNFRLFKNDDVNNLLTTSNLVTVTAPPSNFTLNVAKVGSGTVDSADFPKTINCGATCSNSYASGSNVNLTAAPSSGSTFTGWGGDCASYGTNPSCGITMTSNMNVTANFALIPQITFVGASSAIGVTVPIPPHLAGDLVIIFAYRSGSVAVPTAPAGWTTPPGGASGVNTNASRVAYMVATADNGVTSGNWGGVTSMVAHVYRGQNLTTPIGASAVNSASLGNTVTYPALTMVNSSGSSWVAGFAGHRSSNTNLQNPPAGMTNRANRPGPTPAALNFEVSGHDTNGGLASWGNNTGGLPGAGTSSGWHVRTIEILSQ